MLFVLLITLAVYREGSVGDRNSNASPSGSDQSTAFNDESQAGNTNRNVITEKMLDNDLLNQSGWGNAEQIRSLLRAGANVNASDSKGDTPLIIAAFHGLSETVDILLEQGADLNAKNRIGNTALMEAAAMNRTETVRLLLARGADENSRNIIGLTALDAAQEKGYQHIVRLLKTGGSKAVEQISPPITDARNELDLQQAPTDGNVEKIRSMLPVGGNINPSGKAGSTALMNAASRGDTAAVQYLLANKANPNLADHKDGRTALMVATIKGHTEIVRALLNSGADPNKRDKSGDTAMSIVQRTGHNQIGRLLKQGGARTPSYNQVLSERKP